VQTTTIPPPTKAPQTQKDYAIIVENISKKFKIPLEKKTTLIERITSGRQRYQELWALRNITFTVKKGETLGIIGENGSGKSTLLKIIAGVLTPDSGSVKVNGKVASLLELGVGFQPDLTAEDNVRLYGAIMGMSKKEIEKKFEEIFEFAELERFRNMKLKNFSSGMYARLAFATAVTTDPDILLIDEVLAVGDEKFQRKCFKRMNEFKKKNKTIILVSHDLSAIKKLCSKAILLKYGEIIDNSDINPVLGKYHAMLSSKEILKEQKLMRQKNYKRFGTRKAEIFDIVFKVKGHKHEDYNAIKTLSFGDKTIIGLKIRFYEDVVNPIAGYIIRDMDGREIYNTNTYWNNIILGKFKENDIIYVTFSQRMSLNSGLYFITVALAYSDTTQFYDWHDNVIQFKVINDNKSCGVVDLQSRIEIRELHT